MPKPENLIGKGFESRPQDINKNGRPAGSRNRGTTTKAIFDLIGVLPDNVFETLKKTVPTIDKNMSVEQMIDTIQAFKAIVGKDTQAAKYLKDNLYGMPKQEVELEAKSTINIEIK